MTTALDAFSRRHPHDTGRASILMVGDYTNNGGIDGMAQVSGTHELRSITGRDTILLWAPHTRKQQASIFRALQPR